MRDRGSFLLSTVILGGTFGALLLIPILALLVFGLRGESLGGLNTEESRSAIWISLKTTAWSTLIVALLGTPLAIRVTRSRGFFRAFLEMLVALPLILPPAAAGLALLLAYGKRGLLGATLEHFGVSLAFSPSAVVLAQVFVGSPFFVRAAIAAFDGVDPDILGHAALDGAGSGASFRTIVLPTVYPGLVVGLITSWARAIGEFGATILFAGNLIGVTQTMPLAIYLGFESDLGKATGLSLLLLGVAAVVLIVSQLLVRLAAG